MSLSDLANQERLTEHRTTAQEVHSLLTRAKRDLADAGVDQVSLDRRFMAAYSAVLSLATIPLACAGYRAVRHRHFTTFEALPLAMGQEIQELADYFDTARQKRNQAQYDQAGVATITEVEELIQTATEFRGRVVRWLHENHPQLLGET